MKLESVDIHQQGLVQTQGVAHAEGRPSRGEPFGSTMFDSGNVEQAPPTFGPRTIGEIAGQHAFDALAGVPTGYAVTPGSPSHGDPANAALMKRTSTTWPRAWVKRRWGRAFAPRYLRPGTNRPQRQTP